MWGNFRGKKKGRRKPFWIFQSTGFMLVASSLSKTSLVFGLGTGTSTCCICKWNYINLKKERTKVKAIIFWKRWEIFVITFNPEAPPPRGVHGLKTTPHHSKFMVWFKIQNHFNKNWLLYKTNLNMVYNRFKTN
jgi:hypothetical protein